MKFAFFLKSRIIFNTFYCIFIFVNKGLTCCRSAYISKSKRSYTAKFLVCYFYVKTRISTDFHNHIRVPLRRNVFHIMNKFLLADFKLFFILHYFILLCPFYLSFVILLKQNFVLVLKGANFCWNRKLFGIFV